LVDGERLLARLARLDSLIEHVDRVRARGFEAYLADADSRLAAERGLQLAIQICIDVGTQLMVELRVRTASDYAGVFLNLGKAGHLPADLAERMAEAARLRNLLVHLYLDVDDKKVFAALGQLDDLREFARVAQELADRDG
jgi:uncharacterized protein YutE (UPF0331/DUF86 family)